MRLAEPAQAELDSGCVGQRPAVPGDRSTPKQNPVRGRPPPCTGFAVALGRTAELLTLLALEPSGVTLASLASEPFRRHPPDPKPTRTDRDRFPAAPQAASLGLMREGGLRVS